MMVRKETAKGGDVVRKLEVVRLHLMGFILGQLLRLLRKDRIPTYLEVNRGSSCTCGPILFECLCEGRVQSGETKGGFICRPS